MEKDEKTITSQDVFKFTYWGLLILLIYCLPGFMTFRSRSFDHGYYVFQISSIGWLILGFVGIGLAKRIYRAKMRPWVEKILTTKYVGEERQYKINAFLKVSLDAVYYTCTTICAYTFFRKESWFPIWIGGEGSCSAIYQSYPSWPVGKRRQMQIYFMFQLGVHLFSVFDMAIFKRKTQRKFHEFLLHHLLAALLMIFSLLCNFIVVGILILVVHDLSDIGLAISRLVIETKYNFKTFNVCFYLYTTLCWIYTRNIVFPFCFIDQEYENYPVEGSFHYPISFQYGYLVAMTIVLECMNLFWSYLLLKIGAKSLSGNTFTNLQDVNVKLKQKE